MSSNSLSPARQALSHPDFARYAYGRFAATLAWQMIDVVLGYQVLLDFPADQAGIGGCTVAGTTVFLGSLAGEMVHVAGLDGNGRLEDAPESVLQGEYGRLRTVVLDADGGLWITTSNRDGEGEPAEDDDKVLRIVPPTAQGNSPL